MFSLTSGSRAHVTAHRMYCISRRGIPGRPLEECAQVWICPRPCRRRVTVALDGTVTVIFPGLVKAIHTGVALDGQGPDIVFGPDSGELAELAAPGIGW